MQHPELYVKNGFQARQDTIMVLKKYLKLLKPKNGCQVLDVGCGPGNVTHDLLYTAFSNYIKQIIGVDKSKNMIKFAQSSYENHPKISFQVMDIVTSKIPQEFCLFFDYIVSFYCLHLVSDHRKALSNMYTMLKPGGSVLLNFMATCVIFDIYNKLIEEPAWKTYLKDQSVGPPTQTINNRLNYFKNLLEEVGFTVELVDEANKDYIYSKQEFKNIATAVNLFKFPEGLQEEFVLYQMDYLRNHNLVDIDSQGNEFFHQPYILLTALASRESV